jgi:lipid-binding SYLF domain-containing protein
VKKLGYIINKSLTAFIIISIVFGLSLPVRANDQQALVDRARVTFESFLADPEMSWLKENLHSAKGLLIVPSLLKAGFVFGGSGGSGVLVVPDAKTGKWSEPAFYTVGSVTFGLQIGGEAAEVIMFARTQKGVDRLLTSTAKLGGDTSISVGPKGMGAKSDVVVDMFSFSRSAGAYAGLSLEGSVVKTREKWNKSYYGQPATPADILIKNAVKNPGTAGLRDALNKASKK